MRVKLRWISGEQVPDSHLAYNHQEFIARLGVGHIPGVRKTNEGEYKLVFGLHTFVENVSRPSLRDLGVKNDDELILVHVADDVSTSSGDD